MGFLGNLIGAVIKTAVIPVAIVKDVVTGELPETTTNVADSAINSAGSAVDDLINGDLL